MGWLNVILDWRAHRNRSLGGATISYGNLNPDDPDIMGEDDTTSQSSWVMRQSSSTLNIANSPHLEFSVAVRVIPFATPTARDVRLNRYDSDPAPQPLDGSVDTLVPSVVSTAIGGTQDWIAAFVGTLAD